MMDAGTLPPPDAGTTPMDAGMTPTTMMPGADGPLNMAPVKFGQNVKVSDDTGRGQQPLRLLRIEGWWSDLGQELLRVDARQRQRVRWGPCGCDR
jgi:hypothetical protein